MIKRKIASDAPHVARLKEVMLNRVNQINVYPEFLRPDIIETQIDSIEMAIDQLDPNNFEYDEIRSQYYSEWSDAEISDYRSNFLAGEVLPKLKAMMGSAPDDVPVSGRDINSITEELMDMVDYDPKFKEVLDAIITALKDERAPVSAEGYVRVFLLGITRTGYKRSNAFDLMLDLFEAVGGEEDRMRLENFIMSMERDFNDEGRSFLYKLSSKTFNDLIAFANHLDSKGLVAEADALDSLIQKSAEANNLSLEEVLKRAEEYGFEVSEKAKDLDEASFERLVGFYSSHSKLEDILSAEDEDMASDVLDKPKEKSRYSIIRTSFKAAKQSFLYIKNAPNNMRKFLSIAISALMAAGYIVLPIDIIPDVLVGIGWVDDILSFAFILRFVASRIDSNGWNGAVGSDKPDLIELKEEDIEEEEEKEEDQVD